MSTDSLDRWIKRGFVVNLGAVDLLVEFRQGESILESDF